MMATASCPLCDHDRSRPSWFGSTLYRGQEYPYAECPSCGTVFCDPMPDEQALAQMYGPDYHQASDVDPNGDDPKEPERAIGWLRRLERGTFVDFGCGAGQLLDEARRLGWQPVGVEFDREVAQRVAERTGARVATSISELAADGTPVADVLHLGDVIEHLTDLKHQFPRILGLVKPGGYLLAQGPLEGGPTLFTLALRLARSLKRSRPAEMAPYHVILATVGGQREFFRRFGLEEVEYVVHEVAWPAPARLSRSDWKHARTVGLYTVSRLSRAASALRPGVWGNRYFYAGRRGGDVA
jgi:SAM-dependent methyltransferase